jgi:hypothetical protein
VILLTLIVAAALLCAFMYSLAIIAGELGLHLMGEEDLPEGLPWIYAVGGFGAIVAYLALGQSLLS